MASGGNREKYWRRASEAWDVGSLLFPNWKPLERVSAVETVPASASYKTIPEAIDRHRALSFSLYPYVTVGARHPCAVRLVELEVIERGYEVSSIPLSLPA